VKPEGIEMAPDRIRSYVVAAGAGALALLAAFALLAGVDLLPATPSPTPEGKTGDVSLGPEPAPEARSDARQSTAPGAGAPSFREGFAPVVEKISDAVVTITVRKRVDETRIPRPRLPEPFDDFFDPPRERSPRLVPGIGSGFVISEDGYVVTNNHVVEGAEEITLTLSDRREIDEVEVVGRDPQTDVALLKIDAPNLTPAPLGHSDRARVGEWVLAIGSPGVGSGNLLRSTVTAGIVSAKGRSLGILGARLQRQNPNAPNLAIENFIQTDAVINQGNSGGPLVNVDGEVIGVNTAILSRTGTYIGYGFAVPAELVGSVVEDLKEYGEVRRAVLGVTIQDVTSRDAAYFDLGEVRGVVVQDYSDLVDGPNPARDAGIRPGDVILSVEGRPVTRAGDLQSELRAYDPGDRVSIEVIHRGDRQREEVEVRLGAVAGDAGGAAQARAGRTGPEDPLGLEVESLDPEIRRQLDLPDETTGVMITELAPRGPLARATGGIERFTIIEDVNGRAVDSVEEYRAIVGDLEPGEVANLRLYMPRSGQRLFVSVEIPGN